MKKTNDAKSRAAPESTAPPTDDAAKAAEFCTFLGRHRGEKQVVALQDYPDPDAIAAGLAYRTLAGLHDIEVDIVYDGRVSHQENLALVHVLDIPLTPYVETLPLDRYDGAVFIDNQGTTTRLTERLEKAGIPTLAVIDHHTEQNILSPEFADIRPLGAATTIFTDYLRHADLIELDAENAEHAALATALMHALRSETNGFMNAGPEEYAAGAYLSRFHDPQLVEKILRVQRSRGTMDVIRLALIDRYVESGFSIAGVGYVRHGDRDAIPQAADFLLTEENVSVVIVYGILTGDDEREAVVGSLRTTRLTLEVDRFLKSALGADARGRYYGGGRAGAGGFEIPVGFLEGTSEPDQMRSKWETFDRLIRSKLLRAAGLGVTEPDED